MSYPGMKDLKLKESVIFERSREGRRGYSLPEEDLKGAENILPAELRRKTYFRQSSAETILTFRNSAKSMSSATTRDFRLTTTALTTVSIRSAAAR